MSENKLIIFHPGEYVSDALEAMNMTQNEFSLRSGISEKNLSTLINGKSDITFEVAEKLADFFHNSIDFWTNLQNRYDSFLKAEEKEKQLKQDWEIVKLFDPSFLLEVCNIDLKTEDREVIINQLCELFMVGSLSYLKSEDMFVFLKTNRNIENSEKEIILRNAWISLAMKKANELSCEAFDCEKLKKLIPELKKMTRMDPEQFTPLLCQKLSDAGVKYVELPYLKNSNVRGVTKWIPNEKCVVIAVNDCGKVSDKIWFTVFHELGHAIKNHKRHMTISTGNKDDLEEIEADRFAQDSLIDPEHFNRFINDNKFDLNSIRDFAEKEGVSDAIVIGRLEKEGFIKYGTYSRFKERYMV